MKDEEIFEELVRIYNLVESRRTDVTDVGKPTDESLRFAKLLTEVLRPNNLLQKYTPEQIGIWRRARQEDFEVSSNESGLEEYRSLLSQQISEPRLSSLDRTTESETKAPVVSPPLNAEYVLYLLLRKQDRDVVTGDLVECYNQMLPRFGRRHANVWYYKQVASFLLPLFRRTLLRIGALVWLGRILRRLVS